MSLQLLVLVDYAMTMHQMSSVSKSQIAYHVESLMSLSCPLCVISEHAMMPADLFC